MKGGCVLTLDPQIGDFAKADILVKNGKIAAVGPELDADDVEMIDASNTIVMPGFVDTHRHMWEGFLRNLLPDASLADYLELILLRIGPRLSPEDVYMGNLVSALGAIDAGVTTVVDVSHIQNTPEHSDAAIQALLDAGGRAVFGYGRPLPGIINWWEDTVSAFPHDIRRIRRQYFSSNDKLVTLAMAANMRPYEIAERDWRLARDVDVRITVHSIPPRPGEVGCIEQLSRANLLGPDTTYIHCNNLSATAWKMLADTGGSVSLSPYVETMMGHGEPPIQMALNHGIRPSLSADVETTVPGDLFTQMRSALSVQRGAAWRERHERADAATPLLTSRQVLEFATIDGAKASGLDSRIGTLTPGKDADLILLRTDRLNVLPMNDPVGAVVANMDRSNVDAVFVQGRALKWSGEMLDVNLGEIGERAAASRDRVLAGLNLH